MSTLKSFYAKGVADVSPITTATGSNRDNPFSSVTGAPALVSEKIVIPNTSGSCFCTWSGLSAPTLAVKVAVTIGGTFASVPFLTFRSGTSQLGAAGVTSAGSFIVRDATNTSKAFSSVMAAGDYLLELRYTSAGTLRAVAYDVAGVVLWDSLDQAAGTTSVVTSVEVGRSSSTAYGVTISKVVVVDAFAAVAPDPVVGAAVPAARKQGALVRIGGVWT